MDRVSTGRQRPPLARDLLAANIKDRSRTSSVSSEMRSVGHTHPRPFRPKPDLDDYSLPETTELEQGLPEPTRTSGDHLLYVAPGPWPRAAELMKDASIPVVPDTTKARPRAPHDTAPAPKDTGTNSSTSHLEVGFANPRAWRPSLANTTNCDELSFREPCGMASQNSAGRAHPHPFRPKPGSDDYCLPGTTELEQGLPDPTRIAGDHSLYEAPGPWPRAAELLKDARIPAVPDSTKTSPLAPQDTAPAPAPKGTGTNSSISHSQVGFANPRAWRPSLANTTNCDEPSFREPCGMALRKQVGFANPRAWRPSLANTTNCDEPSFREPCGMASRKQVRFANPRAWRPSLANTTNCDEPSFREPCGMASRKSVGHAHPRPFRPKPDSDDYSFPETTGLEQGLPEPTGIAGDHSFYEAPGPWPRATELMKDANIPDSTKTRPLAPQDAAPAPEGTGTNSTTSHSKVGFANPPAWRSSFADTTNCDEPSSREPRRMAPRKSVGHAHPRPFRPKPDSDDYSLPETTGLEQGLPETKKIAGDYSLCIDPGPSPRTAELMKDEDISSGPDTTKTIPGAPHDSAPAPEGTVSNSSFSQSMGHIPADDDWYKQERGVSRGYIKRTFHKCICNRPHTTIVCHVCGYITTGRLRLYCPQHSNYTFLMDLLLCPRCKTSPCMMKEVWPRVVQEDRPGKQ